MKIITIGIINDLTYLKQYVKQGEGLFDEMILLNNNVENEQQVNKILEETNVKYHLITDCSIHKHEVQKMRSMLWNIVKTKANEGDWIFYLDCDEIICDEVKFLKKIIPQLPKDIDVMSFKKVEMWDDNHYRVDGIWSSYFIRGAKYIPCVYEIPENEMLEYAKQADGKVFPKAIYSQNKIWNSDMRIKVYKYDTKQKRDEVERLAKQHIGETQWVIKQHYLTVNEKPILKELRGQVVLPHVRVFIPITTTEQLNDELMKKIEKMDKNYYGQLNITIPFMIEHQSNFVKFFEQSQISKTIRKLELLPVNVLNATDDRQIIFGLNKACFKIAKQDSEYGYYCFFHPQHPFDPTILNHLVLSEKHFLIDGREDSHYGYAISEQLMKNIDFNSFTIPSYMDMIINHASSLKFVSWVIGKGMPLPLEKSMELIFNKAIPAFVSMHPHIKSKDYIEDNND